MKGAVIHSHGMECVLATLLAGEDATEFRITHQEMIKGIAGACYSNDIYTDVLGGFGALFGYLYGICSVNFGYMFGSMGANPHPLQTLTTPFPFPKKTGHGYLSELVIPIIENTPHEADLADSLGDAIRKYPKASLFGIYSIYVG